MDKVVLTREGYDKLFEELHFLQTTKRKEVAHQLEKARAHGDLRENAEYDAAKETKQRLEERISALQQRLSHAQILDPSEVSSDRAFLGTTLEIKNLDSGDVFKYMLVAEDEADFSKGKISVSSPIGKGLLGKAVNEPIEIKIPAGTVHYQILNITRS